MRRPMPKWLTIVLASLLVFLGYTFADPATSTTAEAPTEAFVYLQEEAAEVELPETEAPQLEVAEEAVPETEAPQQSEAAIPEQEEAAAAVTEDGEYTSKEEVALYLHLFNHLPSNFIKKQEAQDLGWVSNQGNLHKVAPGKSIGGDRFGNYENLLPTKKGRKYFECDIDFDGTYRNAKRIIFSNDGLIYYTDDHYESFTLLYGEE